MPIKWLKRFPERIALRRRFNEERDEALRDVGQYVRAKAATYPPKADSAFYKRTGTLGRSIAVTDPANGHGGRYVEVGTNLHYAPYVEYGTGIYGPRGVPIVPTTAKALAWRSTGSGTSGSRRIAMGVTIRKGKIRRAKSRDQYMNFAKSVKGMRPWHFMQKAFEDPASAAYLQARVKQMFERVRVP